MRGARYISRRWKRSCSGRQPFVKLDILHRRMLDQIRPKFGLQKLDEKTADELNLAWHRLDAWPDVPPGFARLHRKFILAPCSNGNIALMADIGRRNNLPWDAILGSEIARDFKPKPRVYLASVEALNFTPNQVMMVAAHSDDLRSAASNGLRTAHIARPEENPGISERLRGYQSISPPAAWKTWPANWGYEGQSNGWGSQGQLLVVAGGRCAASGNARSSGAGDKRS